MIDDELKKFAVQALRRASYRWPNRSKALFNARVSRGLYECAHCKLQFKKKEVQLDHILPVVDIKDGFIDFDTFIKRLFCSVDNFAVLCKQCHSNKTQIENELRKINKKKKKSRKT